MEPISEFTIWKCIACEEAREQSLLIYLNVIIQVIALKIIPTAVNFWTFYSTADKANRATTLVTTEKGARDAFAKVLHKMN